jgi:hypothetical protein
MNKTISAEAFEAGGYKAETLQPEHHLRLHREYKEMARQALGQGQKLNGILYKKKSEHHLQQFHEKAGAGMPMAKSEDSAPKWHAQYQGKMYPVEDIVDSKKPAHEGGGNCYKLTGVGLVHQNDIENLVHESEMKSK